MPSAEHLQNAAIGIVPVGDVADLAAKVPPPGKHLYD